MKKLIINADDWGLSSLFNKGILKLIKENIVTSVTVMVNRKYINPENILSLKKSCLGLHLELFEKSSALEIESQIEKFKKFFNQMPSHLDSHQHSHLSEYNLSLVLKVAQKYNLPLRSRFPEDRKKIQRAGVKTPSEYIGWHPNNKTTFLKKLLQSTEEVTEVVCHPGYYDKNCDYPYNKQRGKELKILKSKEFQKIIKKFELISYNEL